VFSVVLNSINFYGPIEKADHSAEYHQPEFFLTGFGKHKGELRGN
jgi:hypothetical protein